MTVSTNYHVRVRTKSGAIKIGHLPAADHGDLLAKLHAHGWHLIEIIPQVSSPMPRAARDDGVEIGPLKGWLIGGSALILVVIFFAIAGNSPPSSTKSDPLAISAAEREKLDAYQAVTTRVAQWHQDGVQVSSNHATVADVDAEAFRLQAYERAVSHRSSSYPPIAENGDRRGIDNDGDGRTEPVRVSGHMRSDGTYVREHYRALPQPTGETPSPPPSPASTGGSVQVRGYYRKDGTYVRPHTRSAPRR